MFDKSHRIDETTTITDCGSFFELELKIDNEYLVGIMSVEEAQSLSTFLVKQLGENKEARKALLKKRVHKVKKQLDKEINKFLEDS